MGHCTALWANWCASVSEAFRGDPALIPTFFKGFLSLSIIFLYLCAQNVVRDSPTVHCTAQDHVVRLPDAAGKSGNKEEKRIYILCYALQENYTNHVALKYD